MSLRDEIEELKETVAELVERIEELEGSEPDEDEPPKSQFRGFETGDRLILARIESMLKNLNPEHVKQRLGEIANSVHTVNNATGRTNTMLSGLHGSFTGPADRLDKCASKVEETTRALAGQLDLRARIAKAVRSFPHERVFASAVVTLNGLADAIENPTFGDNVPQGDLGSFRRNT